MGDFERSRGPCAVVGPACAGYTLHKFTSRAFREYLLQRQASGTEAHRLLASKCFHVNGKPATGGCILALGDLVQLDRDRGQGGTVPEDGGRRRMTVSGRGADLPAVEDSVAFRAFYRAQCLAPAVDWARSLDLLRLPLPASFRLNIASPLAHDARAAILRLAGPSLRQVPWMARGSAFALAPGPPELTPAAAAGFAELLGQCQLSGEVVQQEIASMLPAALLAPVPPDAAVLDLCCAPGSKSTQLLDMVVAAAWAAGASLSSSVIVANDVDAARLERTKCRVELQPSAPVVLTCWDAKAFPTLVHGGKVLLFDRILVDAPCSGDGTLRKNPGKWASWSVAPGLRNHREQLAILRRGMELLQPGGRLVYSTCSLNPVECEAVVHAALETEADFELLDAHALLGDAAAFLTPGLERWLVPHPGFHGGSGDDGLLRERLEEGFDGCAELLPSMFPPTTPSRVQLRRCARVLPSAADCGGFFAAVIQRGTIDDGPRLPARRARVVAPLCALAPGVMDHISNFFELDWSQGGVLAGSSLACVVATGGSTADGGDGALTCIAAVSNTLLHVELPEEHRDGLMGCGLPVFARMPSTVRDWPEQRPWRICQQAASLVAACATRRKLRMAPPLFASLLKQRVMRDLLRHSTSGMLIGLDTCLGEDKSVEAGAVVVSCGAHADLAPHAAGLHLSAVLLYESGATPSEDHRPSPPSLLLEILAGTAICQRFSRVLESPT